MIFFYLFVCFTGWERETRKEWVTWHSRCNWSSWTAGITATFTLYINTFTL